MPRKVDIILDLFDGQDGSVIQARPPPSELRLFRRGVNPTLKGDFTFDTTSVESVVAKAKSWGVDLSIDYDHAMVSGGFFDAMDPAQRGKAAGWFKPDVRAGELWATNIKWTPRAAEAISQGEWRYVSPAFNVDDSGRITELINIAVTNIPATMNPAPLRALSRGNEEGKSMDPRLVILLKALGLGDAATEAQVLAKAMEHSELPSQLEKLTAKVTQLETERAKAEAEKLSAEIDSAVKDGRVSPAQRELFLNLGKEKPQVVREFLASAPKIVNIGTQTATPPAKEPSAATTLSVTERRVCKLTGVSEEAFLATKKARAEKARAAEEAV